MTGEPTKLPDWARAGREGWRWNGAERPPFAEPTAPGEESVWDYPRPPVAVRDTRRILVRLGRTVVADSTSAIRVLETASPPTFYIPPADVRGELLRPAPGESRCEWKGTARYWSVRTLEGERVDAVAWSYADPFEELTVLKDHLSFYPAKVACFVEGVRVESQRGGLYGGWITPEVRGPFKGDPGGGAW